MRLLLLVLLVTILAVTHNGMAFEVPPIAHNGPIRADISPATPDDDRAVSLASNCCDEEIAAEPSLASHCPLDCGMVLSGGSAPVPENDEAWLTALLSPVMSENHAGLFRPPIS